jgi:hypothetical protein
MRVGASHSWYYQQGEWDETKVAPHKWQFTYAVNKRRKRDAPEGSGAPVGTEYHWYILAHQNVRKLNANEYSTSMTGVKYKLAHRRAASKEWSASGRATLRQLITILGENIIQLRYELGKEGSDSSAMPLEAGALGVKKERQRKGTAGGRGILLKNSPTDFADQPPLEMYVTP